MDYDKIALEIKEELMIYIAGHLPFVIKGSFLTSQYHRDPYKRLLNGGDIDLVYRNRHSNIPVPEKFGYGSYHQFIREIEKLLEKELVAIFYKLEEIMARKLNLQERPEFILEFEELGYGGIFRDSGTVALYLVNYAADGDFTTVGLEICDCKMSFEIDIAIDMPLHFQPETILYKTVGGKEVVLENTTPLLYQTAWKMHQILVRPRLKDLDDVIRFLAHIDFKDKNNFQTFFDEIISECRLADTKTCEGLISVLKKLFSDENTTKSLIVDKIVGCGLEMQYYSNLYGIHNNAELLKNKVCASFLKELHHSIDCEVALGYINNKEPDSWADRMDSTAKGIE